MRKTVAIITFLLYLGCNSFAQTLKGHIYDARTNEPLVGAAVTYKLHGNQGAVSNINGEYEIKLPPSMFRSRTSLTVHSSSLPSTSLYNFSPSVT